LRKTEFYMIARIMETAGTVRSHIGTVCRVTCPAPAREYIVRACIRAALVPVEKVDSLLQSFRVILSHGDERDNTDDQYTNNDFFCVHFLIFPPVFKNFD
jgi:hypothetical protein